MPEPPATSRQHYPRGPFRDLSGGHSHDEGTFERDPMAQSSYQSHGSNADPSLQVGQRERLKEKSTMMLIEADKGAQLMSGNSSRRKQTVASFGNTHLAQKW